MEAGRRGGTYPAVLVAADEVAVDHFLAGRLGFMDIPRLIRAALAEHHGISEPTGDQILEAGVTARALAENWVDAHASPRREAAV
jgi:1-deoxy-D-xylulose-5-phosphate reductoisomerase